MYLLVKKRANEGLYDIHASFEKKPNMPIPDFLKWVEVDYNPEEHPQISRMSLNRDNEIVSNPRFVPSEIETIRNKVKSINTDLIVDENLKAIIQYIQLQVE